MADGTLTPEYIRFHDRSDDFTNGIKGHLPAVATKLHAKGLISEDNMAEAMNDRNNATVRASAITQILLGTISLDKTTFYEILHIFQLIDIPKFKLAPILKIFDLKEEEANVKKEEAKVQTDSAAEGETEVMMNIR